jgi:hypothetical protein
LRCVPAGQWWWNHLSPLAPELVFVVVIPAGTLLSDQGSRDVPHILLAGITRMDITCTNCNIKLERVFEFMPSNIQCFDALPVAFNGGYGMFYDDIDESLVQVLLCKNCALKLFEALPNLKHYIPSDHFGNVQDIET